jgi:hypothetical protein
MIIAFFIIGVFFIALFESKTDYKIKTFEIYILIDKDERVVYSGSKEDCKKQLTKDYKIIKLEGTL